MSAFMVSDRCLNEALHAIIKATPAGEPFAGSYPINTAEELTALGRALRDLNGQAVNQRYGDGTAESDTQDWPPFEFKRDPRCTVAQMAMSIGCLLYQCSEGAVPGLDLFKALEAVEEKIKTNRVVNSRAYKNAKWG